MKNIKFVMHEQMTEVSLKQIIQDAERDTTQHRIAIARNDQISAQAKLRLLSMELAAAERE